MRRYRYVERDSATGTTLYEATGNSIEETADKVGFDWDDAANLWAGVQPGSPVIDRDMDGKGGITYSREFHIDIAEG